MPECPSCGANYSGSKCPYCARTVKDGDNYIQPKSYDRYGRVIQHNGESDFYIEGDDRPYQSPPITNVPSHGYTKGTPMRGGENPMLSRLRRDQGSAGPLKTTLSILSPKAARRMAERYDRAYDYEYDYRFGYRPPVTAKSVIGCLISVAVIAGVIIWLILR